MTVFHVVFSIFANPLELLFQFRQVLVRQFLKINQLVSRAFDRADDLPD